MKRILNKRIRSRSDSSENCVSDIRLSTEWGTAHGSYMRRNAQYIVRLGLAALLLAIGVDWKTAVAQEYYNYLSNHDFESTSLSPWGPLTTSATKSTAHCIGGSHSLEFGPSSAEQQVNQYIRCPTASNDYIYSANVKVENGDREVTLLVIFNDDGNNKKFWRWDPAGETNWRKISFRFSAPDNTQNMRVFLTVGQGEENVWFDHVQLSPITPVLSGATKDGINMVVNGCFDGSMDDWTAPSGWSGYTMLSKDSKYGSNSLQILGNVATNTAGNRYVTQFVNLQGRGFDPDKPIYTISAHIKTIFLANIVLGPGDPDDINNSSPSLWENHATETQALTQVPGSGARILIRCFDESHTPIRVIKTPFTSNNHGEFVERKFSFLVPAGTAMLTIEPQVFNSNMIARFDNIRLVKNNPTDVDPFIPCNGPAPAMPFGGSDHSDGIVAQPPFTSRIGPFHRVVEAPEPGTSLDVEGTLTLQDAIDSVTLPGNADYGKIVWVPANFYASGTGFPVDQFIVESGLHLKMHRNALFYRERTFIDNMWHGALFRNSRPGNPISDVIIEGGAFFCGGVSGSVIGICGDRFLCASLDIVNYGENGLPSSALHLLGNHIYVQNNYIRGPDGLHGIDGIHLWGGTHLHVMSNYSMGGDDALALYTSEHRYYFVDETSNIERVQEFSNRDISDIEIFNNELHSKFAHCFAAGLVNVKPAPQGLGPAPRLTASVQRVRMRNFSGSAANPEHHLLYIVNSPAYQDHEALEAVHPGESLVDDIDIQNGWMTGVEANAGSYGRPPNGITIFTDNVGTVQNVAFDNVHVDGMTRYGISIVKFAYPDGWAYGRDNQNIMFTNCVIDGNGFEGPDARMYRIDGAKNVEIYDVEVGGNQFLNSSSVTFPRIWNDEFVFGW